MQKNVWVIAKQTGYFKKKTAHIRRGGFGGGGGGGGRLDATFPLRDSTPCRPKGSPL